MRKIVIAAMAGTGLALSACSQEVEETPAETAATDATAEPATDAPVEAEARLDPNTATAEQLGAVDGMTPELAAAVVAGRPYANVVAFNTKLREALSEEQAAAVLTNVFVPVNLNNASREEIALIPGMTDRMIGEFLEYRPYENMEEFNREIGKYVDEFEVARFRNYVTL
jgi:DNA uptake protein ComE-like DNA-binding protein